MNTRLLALLGALLALCAFFAARVPEFVTARNLSLIMIDFAITATLAVGMLLVILPGHIDLSAGSGVGLIGGIAAVLATNHHWPPAAAMTVAICAALLLWFTMGSLIVLERIPAFIITLGGLLIFKGLFWLTIQNHTVPVTIGGEPNLFSILTTYYLPAPAGYGLAAAVVSIIAFAQIRTRSGRKAAGLPVEDAEVAILKWVIAAQLTFLFVIITNQFRG